MTNLDTKLTGEDESGSEPDRRSGPPREPVGSESALPPREESLRALAKLIAAIVVVVLAAVATHNVPLLVVIVAIVIMVMLHELGHFATAKWSGMKVTEYFFGFGPRLWSIRKGETLYGIKAIPAGGYVKIIGMTNTEEVDPADEPRTYRQKPFHNRLMVAVAGSAMHMLMAFVLIWTLLVVVGTPTSVGAKVSAFSPLAHNVDPARASGLKAGDVIVGVDGRKITSADQLVSTVSPRAGRPLTLQIERHGKPMTIVVTPVATGGARSGRIGVEIDDAAGNDTHANPLVGLWRSLVGLGREITLAVSGIALVFSPHNISNYLHALTNSQSADRLAKNGQRIQSIVGAVRTATQGAQAGVTQLIEVLIAINVFVGLFNLLPMYPLDGGHVAVAVYEKVRSRRGRRYHADVTKLMPVAYAFVTVMAFIALSSVYLDITHPIANPFH